MKNKRLLFAMVLLGGVMAGRGNAAVTLSSLSNPTLQTLIDAGSSGVIVGSEVFSNFSFVASPNSGPSSAAQVQVQPISNSGSGLQFIASWVAANGANVADVISYDVQATSPALSPNWIDLFSNGTAPAPAAGTFTTTTLTTQTTSGSPAAPLLSTFNDGVTAPVDTTKADVDFATTLFAPQPELQITDSIFAASTAASSNNTGGLATISVVQNTFGSVPEPSEMGWILPPAGLLLTGFSRRRRTER